MYITKETNRSCGLKLIAGEPTGGIAWKPMAPWSRPFQQMAQSCGYGDTIGELLDFYNDKLGCLTLGIFGATHAVEPGEIHEQKEGCRTIRRRVSRFGTLTETLMDGQVAEYAARTPEQVRIFTQMLRNTTVLSDAESYEQRRQSYSDRLAILVDPLRASAVQQFLQYVTGVADFWYLLVDAPEAMEECMEAYQAVMAQHYRLMGRVTCDAFFQGENTSTAMISVEYYRRYGVPQVRQFVEAAHASGKRAILHMCGHLRDLMRDVRDTGMDGIHALTPPPVGNTDFEHAYSILAPNTSILGRFGAQEWIGRPVARIMENLRRILPHRVYHEHPFALIASSDQESFTLDDWQRLRDAIEDYEQEGRKGGG